MKQSMIFGDDKLRVGVVGGSAMGHLVGGRREWCQHGKPRGWQCQQRLMPIFH